jgi:Flp pilus assembly protein TadG
MIWVKLRRAFSPRRNRAALRRQLRRAVGDRRGVAAVEFAMILPAMLAVYFGVAEVAQGVMANRKVTHLNRTLADLTAQYGAISPADIDTVFDAALAMMAPFPSGSTQMVIASVVIDSAGQAKICWSAQRNATAPGRGSNVTLPTDLVVPNTSLIMAKASYEFEPAVGYLLTGTIRIGDRPIYMRPRIGKIGGTGKIEQVERTGSPSTPMCPGF